MNELDGSVDLLHFEVDCIWIRGIEAEEALLCFLYLHHHHIGDDAKHDEYRENNEGRHECLLMHGDGERTFQFFIYYIRIIYIVNVTQKPLNEGFLLNFQVFFRRVFWERNLLGGRRDIGSVSLVREGLLARRHTGRRT